MFLDRGQHALVKRRGRNGLCGLSLPGFGPSRVVNQARQIQPVCLPVSDVRIGFKHLGLPHHGIHRSETKVGHDFAQLLCHESEHLDDVLWFARKQLSELRILGRNANWASVQVTFSHHDAPLGDQRGGGHTPLFCAKQGRHSKVTSCANHAVCLNQHPVAQSAANEGLVGFGQAELPRDPSVLNGAEGRRPCSSVHS